MGDDKAVNVERRKHRRISYPSEYRPVFRVRGHKLRIKDVSRGGLRFSCPDKIGVKGWVNGRVDLIDGSSIEVEGIVVRVDNKDMGLSFIGELKDDVFHRILTAGSFAAF
ncbi:MAG: PilZ domain-containing protein [Desulfobacterales bacterium]|nr:PilZ domain-containing protein [Desulfobacterales bacterium]